MAASAPSSLFLDHLLTLLASYDSGIPLPPAYPHASSKEAAVEHAIAELAKRLKRPVDTTVAARSAASNGGSSMDWNSHETQTPDLALGASSADGSHESQGVKNSSSYSCPTCGRAPSADSRATTTSDHHAGGPVAISATDELQLLKVQVQDVARAVANGDLTQKITVLVQDPAMVQLKEVINTMVERLAEFASEVTRVSDEVGTQGILGGQVYQDTLGGTWQNVCRTVNRLAANLTTQVRAIAEVTKAVALGDLSNLKMIEVDAQGEILELKTTVNAMVIQLQKLAWDVSRVFDLEASFCVGTLGRQADVPHLEGEWRQLTNSVKEMHLNMTLQIRSIATVIAAVAKGDLTKRIEIGFKGEMGDLKELINEVVEQLNTFTSEVNRVALEVGTMGVLGGQAQVKGAQGTWADLTNNVNKMADSLATQVRSIANVTKAVARGDLQQTVQVDAQGEMLDLKNTVNSTVRQLYILANEITRVSLEVGMEGKLGGQVVVEGVEGMWEVLTNNVNMMAMNLTTQVRSIDEVTKAVTHGDFTKRMEFPAMGELLELKHTVNGMVESFSTSAAGVSH